MGEDKRTIVHLSFSGFKTASACLLNYGLNKIVHIPHGYEDKNNAIMGIVLQKLLEEFVNGGHLISGAGRAWLKGNVERVFLECLGVREPTMVSDKDKNRERTDWVDWKIMEPGQEGETFDHKSDTQQHRSYDEEVDGLFEDYFQANKDDLDTHIGQKWHDIYDNIDPFVDVIKEHRLVAADLRSEVLVQGYIKEARAWIYGSVDFISLEKKLIYDAKGTKYGTQYLDNRQLLWYRIAARSMKDMDYTDCHHTHFLLIRDAKLVTRKFNSADIRKLRGEISRLANSLRISIRRIAKETGLKEGSKRIFKPFLKWKEGPDGQWGWHVKRQGPDRKVGWFPKTEREYEDRPQLHVNEDPRTSLFVAKPSKYNCRFCSFKRLELPDGEVFECQAYKSMTVNDGKFAGL